MVDTKELRQQAENNVKQYYGEDSPGFDACVNAEMDNIRDTQIESLSLQLAEVTKAKDGAYWERNQLVVALTKVFPAWREKHPDSDITWEDDWRNIVFIELPTGQASWHIHDSEYDSFKDLPQSAHGICSWDGHTTEEKYERLAKLTLQRK